MTNHPGLGELEAKWGKLRVTWTLDEWREAATILDHALGIAVGALEASVGAMEDARSQLKSRTTQSLKRRLGRPPKKRLVGLTRVRVSQPLSERHLNFKASPKYPNDTLFALICSVEAEKLRMRRKGVRAKDKDALQNVITRLRPGERKTRVAAAVKTRWQPLLSKARKQLRALDTGMEAAWMMKAEEIAVAK